MRRPINWKEQTDDGLTRKVRVSVSARNIKWQFQLQGEERWDYDTPPSEQDWLTLEEKLQNRWQRGQFCQAEIDLVRRRGKLK